MSIDLASGPEARPGGTDSAVSHGAIWNYVAFTAGCYALELMVAITRDAPLTDWVRSVSIAAHLAALAFWLVAPIVERLDQGISRTLRLML